METPSLTFPEDCRSIRKTLDWISELERLKAPLSRLDAAVQYAKSHFGMCRNPDDFRKKLEKEGILIDWDTDGGSTGHVEHDGLKSTLYKHPDGTIFKVRSTPTSSTLPESSSESTVQSAPILIEIEDENPSSTNAASNSIQFEFEEFGMGRTSLRCEAGRDYTYTEGYNKLGRSVAHVSIVKPSIGADMDASIFAPTSQSS